MHIGSQVPNVDAHLEAVGRLLEVARDIDRARSERGDDRRISTFDIGGGIRSEQPGSGLMADYGKRLLAEWPELFDHEVRTEFGQWVHANAGWAATRVESVEERSVPMAFVHLGADFFMRDVYNGDPANFGYAVTVVGATGSVKPRKAGENLRTYDIVGPRVSLAMCGPETSSYPTLSRETGWCFRERGRTRSDFGLDIAVARSPRLSRHVAKAVNSGATDGRCREGSGVGPSSRPPNRWSVPRNGYSSSMT